MLVLICHSRNSRHLHANSSAVYPDKWMNYLLQNVLFLVYLDTGITEPVVGHSSSRCFSFFLIKMQFSFCLTALKLANYPCLLFLCILKTEHKSRKPTHSASLQPPTLDIWSKLSLPELTVARARDVQKRFPQPILDAPLSMVCVVVQGWCFVSLLVICKVILNNQLWLLDS